MGKTLWSTTSACASVPCSNRVQLADDCLVAFGLPTLHLMHLSSDTSLKTKVINYLNEAQEFFSFITSLSLLHLITVITVELGACIHVLPVQ